MKLSKFWSVTGAFASLLKPASNIIWFIGLSGIPGDISTWNAWVQKLLAQISVVDWLLIALGLLFLLFGLGGSWRSRLRKWIEFRAFAPFLFDFDSIVCGGWSERDGLHASQFNLQSENLGRKEVVVSNAYLASRMTGKRLTFRIDASQDNYIKIEDANPIPSGAIVRLKALLYESSKRVSPQGITEAEFVREWGECDFVIVVNGKVRRRFLSNDMLMQSLKRVLPQGLPTPRVTRKKTTS